MVVGGGKPKPWQVLPWVFSESAFSSGLHPQAAPCLPRGGESDHVWALTTESLQAATSSPGSSKEAENIPGCSLAFLLPPHGSRLPPAPCSKTDISTPPTPTVLSSPSWESSQTLGSHSMCLSHVNLSESVSLSVMSDFLWPHGLYPARLFCPWNSPGKNTGVGSHSLLQGIFLTWESNPGLQHCRQILYRLSQSKPATNQRGYILHRQWAQATLAPQGRWGKVKHQEKREMLAKISKYNPNPKIDIFCF